MNNYYKLKRLIQYIEKYKTQLIIILTITFFGMMFGLLQPRLFGKIVDFLTKGNYNKVILLVLLMCLAEIVASLLTYLSTHLMVKVGINVSTDLKTSFYNNMIALPSRQFDTMKSGNLLSRYEADISNLSDFLSTHLISFIMNFFGVIIILYFTFSINYILTLIVIFFIPIVLFIERKFSDKIKMKIQTLRGMNDEYLTLFNETIKGINEIKHLHRESFFKSKMHRFQIVFMKGLISLDAFRNSGNFFKKVVFVILEIIMLLVGVHYIQTGLLTMGSLIAFTNYASRLSVSISAVIHGYGAFNEATVYINRIEEVNTTFDSVNVEDTLTYVEDTFWGNSIEMINVNFRYNDNCNIFENLNLLFLSKHLNIVLGDSGLGKSTIFKLILRLYEQQSGTILFDGKPSNDISVAEIMRKIAYAPQNPYFFNASLSENIRYADLNLTDDRIWEILKMVNLYEFVKSLPNGLETIIHEAGGNFSEGQKQRLNIARAIAKSPLIYLLDEPTSALDIDNRQEILKIIKLLCEKSTVIMITHDKEVMNYFENCNIIEIDEMVKGSS